MKQFRAASVAFIIFTVICGVLYTGIITLVAQTAFHEKANGSIIVSSDGRKEIGSELIGQKFTNSKYLIGRPMTVTNFPAVSDEEGLFVQNNVNWWHELDPSNKEEIPSDLVTGSGSGVDPNISQAAAEFQISRIAKVRGISEEKVREIIRNHTSKRFLGFIGEPGVNVLQVNIELDGLTK